jgi:hypothetical protein
LSKDPIGFAGGLNLHAYVANPTQWVDPLGLLQRNPDGSIKFEPIVDTQIIHGANRNYKHPVQYGHVLADDGTKIIAFKEIKPYAGKDHSYTYDCHGMTFASKQVWINDDQVEAILKGDGYRPTKTPEPGDVAIYREKPWWKFWEKGTIVHSTTVSSISGSDVIVCGKGGIKPAPSCTPVEPNSEPEPGKESAWSNESATYEYYTKKPEPPEPPPQGLFGPDF